MFDLLKNKLSSFISNVKKSVTKTTPTEEAKAEPVIEIPEKINIEAQPEIKREALEVVKPKRVEEKAVERPEGIVTKKVVVPKVEPKKEQKELPAPIITPVIETTKVMEKQSVVTAPAPKKEKLKDLKPVVQLPEKKAPIESVEIKKEKVEKEPQKIVPQKQTTAQPEAPVEVKPSLLTRIQGFVFPTVTVKESDVRDVLEDLELQLIEADVAMPVAQAITSELKEKLVGQQIKYSEFDAFVKKNILDSIKDIMTQKTIDIVSFVREELAAGKKPVKILFVGPNGHGKTTTIAKIAHLLTKNGLSCVLSASDTFRAAAIEQTVEHGRRLNVPVIKHQYGSDPSAVAFDAVKYAEAHDTDVVLIDTAGRQETSRNLIEQLKKIERVAAPHLRIFIGEGIVGHAIIQQVSEFNEAIKIDGVILTKVDCDTKGGSVISIKKATGVPILYLAVGQGYDDLVLFDENFVLSKLMT